MSFQFFSPLCFCADANLWVLHPLHGPSPHLTPMATSQGPWCLTWTLTPQKRRRTRPTWRLPRCRTGGSFCAAWSRPLPPAWGIWRALWQAPWSMAGAQPRKKTTSPAGAPASAPPTDPSSPTPILHRLWRQPPSTLGSRWPGGKCTRQQEVSESSSAPWDGQKGGHCQMNLSTGAFWAPALCSEVRKELWWNGSNKLPLWSGFL